MNSVRFNISSERKGICKSIGYISFQKLISVILLVLVLKVQNIESGHKHGGNLILGKHADIKYSEADIQVANGNNRVINSTRLIIRRENNNKPQKDPKNDGSSSDGKTEAASENSGSQNGPNIQVSHQENISLTITTDEEEQYTLDLQLNKYFLADNYAEHLIGHQSQQKIEVDVMASNCYYTGKVRGYSGSVAAVSTCNGIVGMFRVGNETFEISVVGGNKSKEGAGCLSCRHLVARSSENVFRSGYKCGLKDNFRIVETKRKKRGNIEVWPQDLDNLTRIVEVYCINDFNQYNTFTQDQNAVFQRMKDLVNMASALYHELNLYLVLVGAECWTSNKVAANISDSSGFLENIAIYGGSNIKQSRDVVLLITSLGAFEGGTIGLANTGTACEVGYAYCFICDLDHTPGYTIDTVAHEIGHTLGLKHNDPPGSGGPCPCDDPSQACIMDAYTSAVPPTHWSSCSKKNLTSPDHFARYYCLYNKPSTVFDPASLCGNGLVEAGEQCDCGRAPVTECNPQCCSNTTCQLINNAQCAYGRCCDVAQCQLKPRYTECRAAAGECDLSEYCSGSDPICPLNVYKSYNTPCQLNSVQAYCYEGKCNTREAQCAAMAPDIGNGVADNKCYENYNIKGDWWGNCGPPNEILALDNWVACPTVGDTLCGLLQCATDYTGTLPPDANYNITFVSDSLGNTVRCLTSLDPEKRRYSFVPDGSTCGQNKVCQNQRCIDISSAANCTNDKCSGHGVCNSWGQCHCDVLFGGTYCNETGEGGSVHSNPIAYNGQPTPPAGVQTTTLAETTTTTSPDLGQPTTTTTTPAVGEQSTGGGGDNGGQPSSSRDIKRENIIVISIPVAIVVVGALLCFFTLCCLLRMDDDALKLMPPPPPPMPPPGPPMPPLMGPPMGPPPGPMGQPMF